MNNKLKYSPAATPVGVIGLVKRLLNHSTGVLLLAVAAWAFLAWIALDNDHALAQMTMPLSADWHFGNMLAVWVMWAIMMAAMMLPSALPMILTFVNLSKRGGAPARGRAFVSAYLAVWSVFSVGAVILQWTLQAVGWVNPMITSTSSTLTAIILLVAGMYQFSPLKRVCLVHCRTPLGFLLGEWRFGLTGAFVMGARHGLFCVGCCWALMTLLFVGGVMNLVWVAALSVAIALEKLLPAGNSLSAVVGLALIVAAFAQILLVL